MTNTNGTAKAKADRLTQNNMHSWLCLKKVIPTTVQENIALAKGEVGFGVINYGAIVERDFKDLGSCMGEDKGTFP